MKKGKIKKNYFKNFKKTFYTALGYTVLALVVVYIITDYAMTTDNTQYLQYLNLTAEFATYIHHQIALPFAACTAAYVLLTLDK